jgi:signal transduction histidine kinase
LLGFFIGVVVARPVRMVSRRVERLTSDDFRSSVGNGTLRAKAEAYVMPFLPDETTTLIVSVNKMAMQLDDTLQRLRDANTRLQTLDKAKTVFLDFVAHELRTPLTQLHAIELIRRMETLSVDGQFLIESALGSVERLRTFCFAAEQYVKALSHTPSYSEITDLYEMVPFIANEASEISDTESVHFDVVLPNEGEASPIDDDTVAIAIMPLPLCRWQLRTESCFQCCSMFFRMLRSLEKRVAL